MKLLKCLVVFWGVMYGLRQLVYAGNPPSDPITDWLAANGLLGIAIAVVVLFFGSLVVFSIYVERDIEKKRKLIAELRRNLR